MKYVSYPDTDHLRNMIGHINRTNNFVGLDENGQAIYDPSKPKPIIKFRGTVKLHGCFEKNTLVTLANGEKVAISELSVGDVVLSYDILRNEFVNKEITAVINQELDKKWIKLHFDNNSFIECTEDHKIYTKNRGWVEAKDLTVEDEFITPN